MSQVPQCRPAWLLAVVKAENVEKLLELNFLRRFRPLSKFRWFQLMLASEGGLKLGAGMAIFRSHRVRGNLLV